MWSTNRCKGSRNFLTSHSLCLFNTLVNRARNLIDINDKPFLYAALLMARVLTGEDLTQARPVQELAQVAPRPVLLIHCAADDYIPAENLSALHAVDPDAESWLIPGTGCLHSEGFNVDPAVYGARVAAFFADAFSHTSSEQE